MEKVTEVFQSLEDETRLRIIALLLENDRLCVCDIMVVLQLPQSTVSRHIAHLKKAEWIKDQRESIWVYYSLRKDVGALQKSLLPLLRDTILELDVVRQDRERLKTFGSGSQCA
jgi:ArsR family transcriptional regulator, arsenate/arsenite/antimonite-responsive transcriptional repressor